MNTILQNTDNYINNQPKHNTLKTLITSIILLLIAIVLTFAQLNYDSAIEAAKQSEGTDLAIVEALSAYGFELDWYEEPTTTDKIKALFNHKN